MYFIREMNIYDEYLSALTYLLTYKLTYLPTNKTIQTKTIPPQVLPENLDNLLNCTALNVNNNQLIRLPRCLARMPVLQSLSASKNKISYIPQELSESSSLRIIRLACNLIKAVPDKIGSFVSNLLLTY